MIITQEKIPLPPAPRGRPSEFPFRDMENGESFFVPHRQKPLPITDWRAITGFKFATRRVTENGIEGIRCWRIASPGLLLSDKGARR